jgi:hypothetical protein
MTRGLFLLVRAMSAPAFGAVVLLAACSDHRPPAAEEGALPGVGGMPTSEVPGLAIGPCPREGEVAPCRAVYAKHDGIEDCFEATQSCKDGVWSPCQGEETPDGGASGKRRAP